MVAWRRKVKHLKIVSQNFLNLFTIGRAQLWKAALSLVNPITEVKNQLEDLRITVFGQYFLLIIGVLLVVWIGNVRGYKYVIWILSILFGVAFISMGWFAMQLQDTDRSDRSVPLSAIKAYVSNQDSAINRSIQSIEI